MPAARELYERALAAFRETGDPWGSARSLTDLGYIDCEQGDHLPAQAAFREALKFSAELGHRRGIGAAHWKGPLAWPWLGDRLLAPSR